MTNASKHISVCVLTYKRPNFLKRVLETVAIQDTDGRFTYSIVVTDNDSNKSSEALVAQFASSANVAVTYCVEPQQNISLARNRAIANATGDYVVFIDDDEFPESRWLINLFETCEMSGADGVLGPVKCFFGQGAPAWVIKGRFYERPTFPTGSSIHWKDGRTGNVLLKKEILEAEAFRRDFHRGGDMEFFRRMMGKGHVFVFCNEAVVYEEIPPSRWTRSFMLKRALLRGTLSMQHPKSRLERITKAIIAVPAYALALPFSLLLGQHRFMNILIRLFAHSASLLIFVGVKPIKSQLLTD